jgi:hypothetical protein
LIIASLFLQYKENLVNPVVGCTHNVLNHSKQTQNEEDMELDLESGLELFSKKIEANYDSSFSCVFCVDPCFLCSKNI